jgi:hypothetical protein
MIHHRLEKLKVCYVMEYTPLGNVLMIYDKERETFKYYSDNTIPYRYLEVVGRKYAKQFGCRRIFVDMEEQLKIAEEKWERERIEKADREEKERILKEEAIKNQKPIEQKKNVFAKFKSYNKEAGTGHVNTAPPPKNSIPNKLTEKQENEKILIKERANRYSQEDIDIIENMKDTLKTITVDRIIVISTIEVYNDTDRELDEDYDCDWFINHPYGNHRYMFEYFIKTIFKNHNIIRLPELFDKLSIIKLLQYIPSVSIDSMFHFYNIAWLQHDIELIIQNDIKLCNFVTPPIRLKELTDIFKINHRFSKTEIFNINYKIKTKHFSIFDSKIKGFIRHLETSSFVNII